MMVETMLESSQDFGMSNGALPQWKRELLQRRAARSRPAALAAAPPSPPPAAPRPAAAARAMSSAPGDDEDGELRYGPGIVKRLKSRYLSLALRDAPRRRPSVLRRAASLEHLLDERPPPAPRPPPSRAPRPVSLAAPPPARAPLHRRDTVKRARSVDALSRLDSREDPTHPHPPPPSPSPPPPPPLPPAFPPPPLPPALPSPPQPPALPAPTQPPPSPTPRPPVVRGARPPRRPAPLLRETERPPPDVVRAALRRFESAPARRSAPAARVSAVLRGLEGPSCTSTPEPREAARSPTPPRLEAVAGEEAECTANGGEARPVSRAALEGIARAGSSMRFSFEASAPGAHLPPLAATNAVLVGRARRVGVIRPMPPPPRDPAPDPDVPEKLASPPTTPRLASPAPVIFPDLDPGPPIFIKDKEERRDPPPAALVEPFPRSPPPERESPRPESPLTPEPTEAKSKTEKPLLNGHAEPKIEAGAPPSRLGGAGIERAWNGTGERKISAESKEKKVELKRAGRGARPPAPPAGTSVVFNFSSRAAVPDYVENDGVVLRGSRRPYIKAGEAGVVLLRPDALDGPAADEDEARGRPPSPCGVRFVNDNVLINGRSCMPTQRDKTRVGKLKLQFDDSLTRTFEYPSEISLCEDSESATDGPADPPAPGATPGPGAPAAPASCHSPPPLGPVTASTLAANTHIVSAALCRYTPHKTVGDAFQLGVTHTRIVHENGTSREEGGDKEVREAEGPAAEGEGEAGDARPCAHSAARVWSRAREQRTDLLF